MTSVYLTRLQEVEKKRQEGELRKLQKGFAQFTQFTPEAEKLAFSGGRAADPLPPTDPAGIRSRWWLVQFPDREAEIAFAPPATCAEVLRTYPDALAAVPFEQSAPPPAAAPLSRGDEAAIRAWLAAIGEDDPATVDRVIGDCQHDIEARRWFLERAAEHAADAVAA